MSEHVAGMTSIVVVAADSGPLLGRAVASALAGGLGVEVIVVDNASSDGEVERVERAHAKSVRVLRNPANLGFGPACNRGAAIARGDLLLFLNPDCELAAGSVDAIRRVLAADDRIGLLGVEVCGTAGRPARGNRRRDPTLKRALMAMTGLSHFEWISPMLAGIEMPVVDPHPAVEYVDAVSGACMAVRRTVFDRIAGFDEGYFLHVEDLDLCRRTRDAGWRVAIAHDVRARHWQGSSSRHRRVFVERHKHRGMWRYFLRFDPAARSWGWRCLVRGGLWLHFLALLPLLALPRSRSAPDGDATP